MGRKSAAQKAVEAASAALRAAASATEGSQAEAERQVPAKDLGPLFELDEHISEKHDRTRIYRLEPIDEGHLDDLLPDADRSDIKRRWGGGRFRVQAVTTGGKVLSTDSNIQISGDPIFENQVGQRRYEKWLEHQFGKEAVNKTVAAEVSSIEDQRHQRRLEQLKAENEAAFARAKLEAEVREAAEERKRIRERADRQTEREDAERREDQRRERERAERAEERRADREARATELEARLMAEREQRDADREARRVELEQRGDPMAQIGQIVQLVAALQGSGGAGPAGPWDVAVRAPEILEGLVKTGVQAYDEIKDSRAAKKQRSKVDKTGVHFEGTTGRKALAAMKAISAAGGDPEQVIESVLDRVRQNAENAARKRAPAPKRKAISPEAKAKPAKAEVVKK